MISRILSGHGCGEIYSITVDSIGNIKGWGRAIVNRASFHFRLNTEMDIYRQDRWRTDRLQELVQRYALRTWSPLGKYILNFYIVFGNA